MSFFSWLRSGTSSANQARRRTARKPATFRPCLEVLEGRDLPSTLLTVLNNLDSGAGSLRAEIATARSKDTIVFDPSLKGQTITLTSGELLINKDLTITGPGADQLTVSGGGVSRVFDVYAPKQTIKVALSGLTISNGNASGGWGGGIYNGAENVTLNGCFLSGNHAQSGGAIANDHGTLTVSGCTLSGNHADFQGGGIYNFQGTLTVSNCTLSGNTAFAPGNGGPGNIGEGGAIYNGTNATLTVSGCTLSDNSAADRGGAIFIYDPINTLILSTIGSNNVFSNDSPENVYIGS